MPVKSPARGRRTGGDRLREAQGPAGPDLPPAVLASVLGVRIQAAVDRAGRTRRDWTAYLAERMDAERMDKGAARRSRRC